MNILTGRGANGDTIAIFTMGASQDIAYNVSGGADVKNVAFDSHTRGLLLSVGTEYVRVAFGPLASVDVTSTSTRLPPGALVGVAIHGGWGIAVVSDGATNASTLNVTELASGPA